VTEGISDSNRAVPTPTLGGNYYWRVNTHYTATTPDVSVQGDVWKFRTEPYKIVFNTDDDAVDYAGHMVPGYTCEIKGPAGSWTTPVGYLGSGTPVAGMMTVFNFDSFDYNNLYDVVVVPEYYAGSMPNTDNDLIAPPMSLAIHVDGDFSFNGVMDISGDDGDPDPAKRNESPAARCGGHRGSRKEKNAGDFSLETTDLGYYYQKVEFQNRYGAHKSHSYSRPTSSSSMTGANPGGGYAAFGPGTSTTAPYKDSGGAGHGGTGGDSGRGYYQALFTGGASYSDKEIPLPFGGSAAAWSQNAPGGTGGGGVEIVATNITLDSKCQIRAGGGTNPYIVKYPAGGGSGGSIKFIARNNFVNNGILEADGGKGGDGNEKSNNTGGGGAGGRIAIFYGGTTCTQGDISVKGGKQGVIVQSGSRPECNGLGLARDGDDGTPHIEQFTTTTNETIRRASAPTPKHGDTMVYAPDWPTEISLKWYSGYNTSDACDVVYFDLDDSSPSTQIASVSANARGEKSVNVDVKFGKTYYFQVKTVASGASTFDTVESPVWKFSAVKWECQEPNWGSYTWVDDEWPYYDDVLPADDIVLKAGWPAWDINHDCVVNNLDLWYFAQDWRAHRGATDTDYLLDDTELVFFTYQWMTCRGRSDDGCAGWTICGNWDSEGAGMD